ncbi:hypothetical protein, partial [Salmonella sp. s32443]|uniref:hypothetical protein n=1 Tax=Salmonella sp. s32443 TaxID=3159639 RepID=UPI00398141F8
MRAVHVALLAVLVTATSAPTALAQTASDEMTWGVQVAFGMAYATVPPDTNTTRSMEGTYNAGLFAALP